MSSDVLSQNEQERVAKGIEEALKEDFPVTSENGRVELSMEEVFVDESNDDLEKAPNYINEARSKAKSYELPVKGTFKVKKDGKTVDTQ
jgi:DNA-directed RNA polymerase beta subunit